MCALVTEAIDAGAAGFSTSFAYTHRGVDGKPVPSRFAERDEVGALFTAAGRTGKGVVLATPGEQCTYADMYEWQTRIGRPFTYPLFALADGRHHPQLALHDSVRGQRGAGLPAGHASTAHHAVHDGQPVQPERRQGLRGAHGPGPRRAPRRVPRSGVARRAAADLEQAPMRPRWETCEVSESARFPELEGRRVDELGA